jgi:hypothetical protein
VSVVCCQVEVSATGWSLVQRSPTECGVSNVCDRETWMKRGGPGPYRAVEPQGEKKSYHSTLYGKGVQTFIGKGSQSLLLAGSRTARVKGKISAIPNILNYRVIFKVRI